jgi:Vacuolar protein sorting-associated protein 62
VGEDGWLEYHPDFVDPGSYEDYIVAGPSMRGVNLIGKRSADVIVDSAQCTLGYTSEMAEGDVSHARVYVNVKWWPGRTYTDLQIWVFFAMNGPGSIRLLGKSTNLSHQGRHQADWEKVTLRVSNAPASRGQPLGVFLSQHAEAEFVPTNGKVHHIVHLCFGRYQV